MLRSSLSRIRSSRANGARSRGPQTSAGKQRSSLNALRHGLLAKQVVLSNGASANFHWMIAQHIRRFGPADGVELGMIEEMAARSGAFAAPGPSRPAAGGISRPAPRRGRPLAPPSPPSPIPPIGPLTSLRGPPPPYVSARHEHPLLLHKTKLPNEPRSPFRPEPSPPSRAVLPDRGGPPGPPISCLLPSPEVAPVALSQAVGEQ